MLRPTLLMLSLAVAAGFLFMHEAQGADFYVETVSAIDGGSSPTTTAAYASKYQGNEVAVSCNYDTRLKVCDTLASTCVASATHGQFLDAKKTFPVCFPMGYGQAAISPVDAGVSNACDFSVVTPKQTCPP